MGREQENALPVPEQSDPGRGQTVSAAVRDGDLRVLEAASAFAADRRSGKVVIISEQTRDFPLAITDLQGLAARRLALGYAARQGVSDPRINGSLIGPYAVTANGVPVESVTDERGQPLLPADPRRQPANYVIEVPVCAKLV